MRGRHRPHGQRSATPWSIRQIVRPNRNRTPNQTERDARVGWEWTDGGTPFALVAGSLSRNAAGNPSSLIRKPNSVPFSGACRPARGVSSELASQPFPRVISYLHG